MKEKVIKGLVMTALTIFPIFGAINFFIPYSPYTSEDGFGQYIILSGAYLLISVAIMVFIANKSLPRPFLIAGFLLFLIGATMTSVIGLGAAPDFTVAGLEHPEREHYRYISLLLNAALAAIAIFLILRHFWPDLTQRHRWILLFLIPAFGELFWEFSHHYFLLDNLQHWIIEGKNAADFEASYSPPSFLRLGMGFFRCLTFIGIAWLALILARAKKIRQWVFIVLAVFCVLGFVGGIFIVSLGAAAFPKIGILNLLLIPAGPCLLMYYVGLGILGRRYTQ